MENGDNTDTSAVIAVSQALGTTGFRVRKAANVRKSEANPQKQLDQCASQSALDANDAPHRFHLLPHSHRQAMLAKVDNQSDGNISHAGSGAVTNKLTPTKAPTSGRHTKAIPSPNPFSLIHNSTGILVRNPIQLSQQAQSNATKCDESHISSSSLAPLTYQDNTQCAKEPLSSLAKTTKQQFGVRRRKSISRSHEDTKAPSSSLPESTTEKCCDQAAHGSAINVCDRGQIQATVLTSAIMRRKQATRISAPSPSDYLHGSVLPTTSVPGRLFFNDPIDENVGKSTTDPATNEDSSEIAEDESLKNHQHQQLHRDHHPSQQNGKLPSGDDINSASYDLERIGELSRDEDEYDFAILLKPSKYEEHLDMPAIEDLDHSDGSGKQTDNNKQVSTDNNAAVINGENLVFSNSSPTKGLHRKKNNPARARNLIVQRIQQAGLQVKRLLSLDGKQTLLKVKAPQLLLEMGAEQMKMRKLRKFDKIWMEFSCELRTTFADFDDKTDTVRFIDSEKQSIVYSLLTSDGAMGAGLNEFCPLKSKYVVQMYPLHKQDLALLRKHWVRFWSQPENPTTLNNDNLPSVAESSAVSGSSKNSTCLTRFLKNGLNQPIDKVAQYFGEKVAFYFAWIEMYTRWLVVPSLVGLVLFVLQVKSKKLDHPFAPFYAMFMALWTSAFLIAWKRRASSLSYRWGTLGYEDVEVTRPEFYGDPKLSDVSTKRYPTWKRYLKYTITIPCVVVSIAIIVIVTFYAFATRDRLEEQSIDAKVEAESIANDIASDYKKGLTLENLKRISALGMRWDFWFYFLITPILYGLLIPVLDYLFTKWARVMNNWENHQTESKYHTHLILKVFSFRFVHVFASLYYYAFANSSRGNSLLRVAIQLASFMIAGQLWKNVMETLYPFLKRRVQAQRKKRATNEQFNQSTVFNLNRPNAAAVTGRGKRINFKAANQLRGGMLLYPGIVQMNNNNAVIHEQCVRLEQASDKAWEEAELERYDTFEDYTEMMIQFGYVSFFSLAFPLAPLLALLNNLLELRTDAFKVCHAKQRPIAHKASGIGIWFQVLQLMSVLAVLTNCLHIAFTTTLIERLFPTITSTEKVWVVFGVEHFVLALQVWMIAVIPSMPSDVKEKVLLEREHAKQESARAMATRMQQAMLLPLATSPQHEMNQQVILNIGGENKKSN